MSVTLDAEERDLILGLLRKSYIKHTSLAKLEHLEGKISKSYLDWHQAHAGFVSRTTIKLEKILNAHSA